MNSSTRFSLRQAWREVQWKLDHLRFVAKLAAPKITRTLLFFVLVAFALLITSPWVRAADFEREVNATTGVDFDTACFDAFQRCALPSLTGLEDGVAYGPEHLNECIAAGDSTITASPVCGAIAPTFSLTGTPPATAALDDDDLGDVTFSIPAPTTAAASTFDIVIDNWATNPLTVPRPFEVTGDPEAPLEVIAEGGRSYFVTCDATGNDTNVGNTKSAPWRNWSRVITHLNSVLTADPLDFDNQMAGDDFHGKAGTSCNLTSPVALPIKQGGASEVVNRQIFGSYYCTDSNVCGPGSQVVVNSPTNFTVSRRPSDYTYTYPRQKIRGTYLQTCRQSITVGARTDSNGNSSGVGPPGLKCAWNTANYASGSGSYGPGGQAAVPSNETTALVALNFSASKKWVTVRDLEIEGSAGYSLEAKSSPKVECHGSATTTCHIESVFERLHLHHNGGSAISFNGVARAVGRFIEMHDGSLDYGDKQFGHAGGGAQFVVASCSECQVLWDGNDVHDNFSENASAYKLSRILYRGFVSGGHSISGGAGQSDVVYEQNIVFGGDPIYSPPNDNETVQGAFPHWSMTNENPAARTANAGPVWANPNREDFTNRRIVRRNNAIATGHNLALHMSASRIFTGGGQGQLGPFAYTDTTLADIGNTVIIGSQARQSITWTFRDLRDVCDEAGEPLGNLAGVGGYVTVPCRARPASFLNTALIQNNLFLVQAGNTPFATWCEFEKGALPTSGTKTMSHNAWGQTPPSSCQGASDLTGTTAAFGLPSVDWLAAEWSRSGGADVLTEDDFTPVAGGDGNGVGLSLAATNTLFLDTGTGWDWVLAQRMWLPACNTAGMMSAANWKKLLYSDYCGNTRSNPDDLGAFINAP